MIRFIPDNLREALLRPIAMAAPDGGVYVEIMAPDLRFSFLILLTCLVAVLAIMQKIKLSSIRPICLMLVAIFVIFPLWLYTTGNGRYFFPFLLLSGLLCIGIVHALPFTKTFRLLIAALMLVTQSVVVLQAGPFESWALARWTNAPYFGLEIPKIEKQGHTIITISGITYSLVAPQFPKETRWMSLTSAEPPSNKTRNSEWAQELLNNPNGVSLLAPAIRKLARPDGLPGPAILSSINTTLTEYGLLLAFSTDCKFLRSSGLASYASRHVGSAPEEKEGFWICSLQRTAPSAQSNEHFASKYAAIFEKIEAICPRFFPPNQVRTSPLPDGEIRQYGGSDMKLYVLDSGQVYYKYFRALNPVFVGTHSDILSSKTSVNCTNIKGRTGLPWERSI